MKDIMKFALSAFGVFLVVILLALMFISALVSDNAAVRYIAFGTVILVVTFLGFFEGGSKGEADAMHQRLMEKRKEDRGIQPTRDEWGRCYRRWKGFVSGLIASSPWVLFSLFVFAMGAMGGLRPWMTVTMRGMLFPYISIFPEDTAATWFYPLLALIYPTGIGIGYMMGPRRFSRILKAIHDNSEKRLRKNRARRKPQPR